MTADSCQWRSERARGTAEGGGLVAVFHPSPLILAARAASTSANDCQTVRDPRRYSSRLTIIHLPPLLSPPPTPYINYDKKLVAAASVQRLINHLRYATRHELARETIGIGRASGIPLIYLIYLRSSTPINTWIRSRGSECVAFISWSVTRGAYAAARLRRKSLFIAVIARNLASNVSRMERFEELYEAAVWDSGSRNVISHRKGPQFDSLDSLDL